MPFRRPYTAILLLVYIRSRIVFASRSRADTSAVVKSIADDYWAFVLRSNPEAATSLGEYQYNDQLPEYSIVHAEADKKMALALIVRLKALDVSALNESDSLDHALLLANLKGFRAFGGP